MIKSLASLLALILAMGGTTIATTGCDALGIGKDSSKDEDEDKKKNDDDEEEEEEEEEEEKAEETTDGATTPASGDNAIKDCPGQQKVGGTRKVLRPLSVYETTDTTSRRITGLAPGTLVNLKFQCGNWIMVEYPSGVGQMSPGWVNVAIRSNQWKVEDEDDDETPEVDAGVEVKEEDAGVQEPPDAGPEPQPDAGTGPKKIRIPKLIRKK